MIQDLFAYPDKLLRDLGTASNKAQSRCLGIRSAAIQVDAKYLTPAHTYDNTWRWVPAEAAISSTSNPSTYQVVRDVLRARKGYEPPSREHVTATHLLAAEESEAPRKSSQMARPVQVVSIDETIGYSITKAYLNLLARRNLGNVETDPLLLQNLIQKTRSCARVRGAHQASYDDVRAAVQIVTSGLEPTPTDSNNTLLPRHHVRMNEQIDLIRADVDIVKSGGGHSPRVLIIGETNGTIARAFQNAGADVATCSTTKPPTRNIPHFTGDSRLLQDRGWDLVIGNPPSVFQCDTNLLGTSVETDYTSRIDETISTFQRMHSSNTPFVVIKQSTNQPTARTILSDLRRSQQVHSYQHGDDEASTTNLYIKGTLPLLYPTCNLTNRVFAKPHNHHQHDTSIGLASAMATQWIPTLLKHQTEELYLHRSSAPLRAHEMIALAATTPQWRKSIASIIVQPPSDTIVEGDNEFEWQPAFIVATVYRPWELPAESNPLPSLPITRLRRTHHRWRACTRQSDSTEYKWVMLNDDDHNSIDEMIERYLPSEQGDYLSAPEPIPTAALEPCDFEPEPEELSEEQPPTQSEIPMDYRTRTADSNPPRLTPIGSIHEIGPSRLLQQARVSTNSQTNWRHSAYLLQRALKAGRPSSRGQSGLWTLGEIHGKELDEPDESRSVIDTIAQHRLDYSTRFVAAKTKPSLTPTRTPVCTALPEGTVPALDHSKRKDFTFADIAKRPPKPNFLPHCAYVRNFVVARQGGTAQARYFRIDAAACRVDSSLTDTGAGPSIIGTTILSKMPSDACVYRVSRNTAIDANLMGPDSKPLVTRGTINLVFTLDGHPFQHKFIVVQGGDLLLLGNDFLAMYNASVTPLDPHSGDDSGTLEIDVTTRGTKRRHQLTVSCKPPRVPTVGAATYPFPDTVDKSPMNDDLTPLCADSPIAASGHVLGGLTVSQKDSNQDSTNTNPIEPDASPETELDPDAMEPTPEVIIETGMRLPPALVEIDGPTSSSINPDLTGPTADERYHSELRTDTYLLYCEKPVSIPARNEATVWVRVPIQLRGHQEQVIIDRVPVREGLDTTCTTSSNLCYVDREGMVPVTLINLEHKMVTIPSASPIGVVEADIQVYARAALDPTSADPYERLSDSERELIDKIDVGAGQRLSEAQ